MALSDDDLLEGKNEDDMSKVFSEEHIHWVLDQFESLPEMQKKVLQMKYFGGLKNKEIEKELDLSQQAVSTHHTRALKSLKNRAKASGLLSLIFPFNIDFSTLFDGLFMSAKAKLVVGAALAATLGFSATQYIKTQEVEQLKQQSESLKGQTLALNQNQNTENSKQTSFNILKSQNTALNTQLSQINKQVLERKKLLNKKVTSTKASESLFSQIQKLKLLEASIPFIVAAEINELKKPLELTKDQIKELKKLMTKKIKADFKIMSSLSPSSDEILGEELDKYQPVREQNQKDYENNVYRLLEVGQLEKYREHEYKRIVTRNKKLGTSLSQKIFNAVPDLTTEQKNEIKSLYQENLKTNKEDVKLGSSLISSGNIAIRLRSQIIEKSIHSLLSSEQSETLKKQRQDEIQFFKAQMAILKGQK